MKPAVQWRSGEMMAVDDYLTLLMTRQKKKKKKKKKRNTAQFSLPLTSRMQHTSRCQKKKLLLQKTSVIIPAQLSGSGAV
eukprot:410138-Ditylum_brightwellii.AAC.1